MRTLLYNPLVCLIGRLWWLPALTLLVLWGTAGEPALSLAVRVAGTGAAFFAGALGAMLLHGGIAVGLRRFRRHRARVRFLCPECLCYASVRYVCAACGKPLPEVLLATNGIYVRACPYCDHALFDKKTPTVKESCSHCHSRLEPNRRHEYRVRALATLLPEDYDRLCKASGVPDAQREEGWTWVVDGDSMLMIINLAALPAAEVVPKDHVLCRPDAIWMSGLDAEPLVLGRAADRLLRYAGERRAGKQTIPLIVDQKSLDPAVLQMLSARFGKVLSPSGRE